MFWLWLPRGTDLLDGRPKKLLHVAPNGPERQIGEFLQGVTYIDYLSGDLSNPQSMVRMDITAIESPSDYFDVILCSHVLEHVPEDRKAMAELFRVLKPGGWAILQVPIGPAEETFEDPTVTDPVERARLFGQFDHVRLYGRDYKKRLENTGFSVQLVPCSELFSATEISRSELIAAEDQAIWWCRKPLPK
jgi:SAM-dependent methyltransferase